MKIIAANVFCAFADEQEARVSKKSKFGIEPFVFYVSKAGKTICVTNGRRFEYHIKYRHNFSQADFLEENLNFIKKESLLFLEPDYPERTGDMFDFPHFESVLQKRGINATTDMLRNLPIFIEIDSKVTDFVLEREHSQNDEAFLLIKTKKGWRAKRQLLK